MKKKTLTLIARGLCIVIAVGYFVVKYYDRRNSCYGRCTYGDIDGKYIWSYVPPFDGMTFNVSSQIFPTQEFCVNYCTTTIK